MLIQAYLEQLIGKLEEVKATQSEAIAQAADLIAQAISDGHALYVFGCSHSSLPTQDVFYRAGGLVLVNHIFAPGLTLDIRPPTFTSEMERVSGFAQVVLNRYPVQAGDVMVLVSVSGRNAVPVEMASEAKERGMRLIVLTGLSYTQSVSSRHPSSRKAYEFADVVIDNLSLQGDTILQAEGLQQRFCSTSGAIGSAIMQALIAAAVERLLAKGITPPIFSSGNVDGGMEHNDRILNEWRDRIFYMR